MDDLIDAGVTIEDILKEPDDKTRAEDTELASEAAHHNTVTIKDIVSRILMDEKDGERITRETYTAISAAIARKKQG